MWSLIFWKLSIIHVVALQESPTSDLGSTDDLTPSDASTPSTNYEPFEPRFRVKVSEPIKDGDKITYAIKVTKVRAETVI